MKCKKKKERKKRKEKQAPLLSFTIFLLFFLFSFFLFSFFFPTFILYLSFPTQHKFLGEKRQSGPDQNVRWHSFLTTHQLGKVIFLRMSPNRFALKTSISNYVHFFIIKRKLGEIILLKRFPTIYLLYIGSSCRFDSHNHMYV